MTLQDNFSEILLISEQPLVFYCNDPMLIKTIKIEMKLPTLGRTLTDPFVQYTLAIFNLTLSDIKSQVKTIDFDSKWDFIFSLRKQNNDIISRNLIYYYQLCFGEQFDSINWTLNGIEIDKEFYERIEEISLISAGAKKFNEQQKLQGDKPQWLIDKENEIKRIKNQNKTNQIQSDGFQELLKTLISLNHEFGYTFEQIFEMNYFHMQHLAKFVPKAVAFDIQKRQIMGKKKIKYITDK